MWEWGPADPPHCTFMYGFPFWGSIVLRRERKEACQDALSISVKVEKIGGGGVLSSFRTESKKKKNTVLPLLWHVSRWLSLF